MSQRTPMTSSLTPKIACLGGGAIGFGVLSRLTFLGVKATVLTRTQAYHHTPQSSSTPGVLVKASHTSHTFYPQSRSSVDMQALELVFITTQTYNLEQALYELAPQLKAGTTLISLCNGRCDVILESFQQKHPHLNIRLGVAFFNSTPFEEANITIGYLCSEDPFFILWGPLLAPHSSTQQPTQAEQELITLDKDQPTGSFFRWADPMTPHYQKKWIFNTTGNTISGALGIRNAQDITEDEKFFDEVFLESYSLASKIWGEPPFTKESLKEQLKSSLQRFQGLEISMHRHLRCGSPTESLYLAGCALDFAPHYPLLRALHGRIQEKESHT